MLAISSGICIRLFRCDSLGRPSVCVSVSATLIEALIITLETTVFLPSQSSIKRYAPLTPSKPKAVDPKPPHSVLHGRNT